MENNKLRGHFDSDFDHLDFTSTLNVFQFCPLRGFPFEDNILQKKDESLKKFEEKSFCRVHY